MVLVRLLFMTLSMRTHEIQQKDYDCVDELDAWGGWFSSVTTFRGMSMRSDLLYFLCVLHQMMGTIDLQLFPRPPPAEKNKK